MAIILSGNKKNEKQGDNKKNNRNMNEKKQKRTRKTENDNKQEPRETQKQNKMIIVNGNKKGELIFNIIITK